MIVAEFDFKSEQDRIAKCYGLIFGELENGEIKPRKIVLRKLTAIKPQFATIEKLALKNARIIRGN